MDLGAGSGLKKQLCFGIVGREDSKNGCGLEMGFYCSK